MILAQGQGGDEFQPAGILKYVEDLKRGLNVEIGPKDIVEIASKRIAVTLFRDDAVLYRRLRYVYMPMICLF